MATMPPTWEVAHLMAEGYGVESTDVDAVWDVLVGEHDVDDDMPWWLHLSTRMALLESVSRRIADERGRIAAGWHRNGDSYAVIAERVGMSRARAQQLVERGRLTTDR